MDYDELVDTHGRHEDVNLEYWSSIAGRHDLALVLSPGLLIGREFTRSGLHHLTTDFSLKTPGNPPEL